MGEFYRNCDCSPWKDNCNIIDSAIIMYGLRGGEKLKDSFFYCPWCGELLKEDPVQAEALCPCGHIHKPSSSGNGLRTYCVEGSQCNSNKCKGFVDQSKAKGPNKDGEEK